MTDEDGYEIKHRPPTKGVRARIAIAIACGLCGIFWLMAAWFLTEADLDVVKGHLFDIRPIGSSAGA